MDKLDGRRRSENMRRISSKNTKPELLLRSLIHRAGYRFRVHRENLPGNPDIVFPGLRKVVFLHGCFWHQHSECREGRIPGSRPEYWVPKLERNRQRDAAALRALVEGGWGVAVVWECELRSCQELALARVLEFLNTKEHGR